MPVRERGTLGLLRVVAGVVIGLIIFCIAVPAASAGTPTPTPTPPARVLPISLHLGRLNISVVVPLTLNGLLGNTTAPATTPPPPPPTTSTPPAKPTTQAATQPTHASATAARISPLPPSDPGRPASAVGVPVTRPAAHHSSTQAAPSPSRTKHHKSGGLVFVKDLVPASGSLLLIALCAACALGVVGVLKLSGRSTHEH